MKGHFFLLVLAIVSLLSGQHVLGYGENGTILFGSSMDLSGPLASYGRDLHLGIDVAFEEINRGGGVLGGYNLSFLAMDDQYQPSKTVENMNILRARNDIFGFAGVLGTATSIAALPLSIESRLPFVGPYTGSRAIRKPYSPYAIHYRSAYEDEVAGMVSFLIRTKGVSKFSILYQNDAFGQAGYNGLIAALGKAFLPLISQGTYESSNGDVTNALDSILAKETEAVILVATLAPSVSFITKARARKEGLVFMAVSVVNPTGLLDQLGAETHNIFFTTTTPFPSSANNHEIVARFHGALAACGSSAIPSFVSLEGYIVGRLIVKGMEMLYEEEILENGVTGKLGVESIVPSKFISVFAQQTTFTLDGISLGPYGASVCDDLDMTDCGCNQGSRSVFFGKFSGAKMLPISFSFSFSTCGFRSIIPSSDYSGMSDISNILSCSDSGNLNVLTFPLIRCSFLLHTQIPRLQS
eukprot:TRINITY_DN1895_c0_g1_i2.p1 TRINITY_DN1895_c0_g1~~TRINITY_DN1895_c0_g1_i2.p1  ORF type:complete len:469 (+),score=99.84 TRINITY_DN1895_c0_g1_i2:61-1467(+)